VHLTTDKNISLPFLRGIIFFKLSLKGGIYFAAKSSLLWFNGRSLNSVYFGKRIEVIGSVKE